METIKCISVREPWAWAIFNLGDDSKDVENRTWPTRYRGPLVIHASRWFSKDQYQYLCSTIFEKTQKMPPLKPIVGRLLGVVDLINCTKNYQSKWSEPGLHHWVIKNQRKLINPIKFTGRLGLFDIPAELVRDVL